LYSSSLLASFRKHVQNSFEVITAHVRCGVCCSAAEILEGALPPAFHSRLAYLSGPSFAAEVARELPTVVTIAAKV
jgi:glycerol-3-phosphate dehydrogenase (NAD(P)+)